MRVVFVHLLTTLLSNAFHLSFFHVSRKQELFLQLSQEVLNTRMKETQSH